MDSSMLDHIIQFVPSKMRRKQLNLLRQKTSKKSKRLLLHALISNLRIGITNQDRLNDALSLLPEKVLASEINSYPNSKLIIFALNQCICKQSNIMRYLSDSIITGDNAITCCRMNILHSQFVPAELNNNLLVLYKLLTIGQRLPESVIFKLLDLLKQLDNAESLRACQMCLCLALNLKSIDTLQRIHFIDDTNYILKYSCLRTQILSTDDSRINYCKMNDFIVDATNICTLKFTESLLEKGCNVLLEGPDGCGKSVMIDFLASFHKRKIVRIQMSEGVDLKEFIGTYHFTADNKVMWIPGAFSKAVIRPCWLIIEDIDLCPPDVLSFLCSIMNNRTFVQSCTEEEVKLHSQFRIVFTYRTTFGKNSSQKNFILSTVRSICCVQMPALNTNSIETIVKSRFPFLHQLTDQIMEVFALLKHYIQSSSLLNRNIGVRDIIKLCDRLKLEHEIEENLFTFDFAVKAFKHCLDCWVSWIPSSVRRFEISRQIGACFSISCEKVNDILRGNGNAKFLNKELICDRGRFELYGRAKSLFCQTPRILNLIVSIYISCLQQESVLLCGETGVGKTSLLQHLSELAGIKLLVVNLSTQTEINDLLGGYKPTDYNTTIRSFWSDFTILFQQCYDSEKNEKFIHILKQYFKKQDWLKLLKAVERPILDALNKKDSNSSWINIYEKQKRLLACIENARLTFEFIEGPIIKAYKEGYWLLLDEINLASAETLFALSTILNRDMIYGANQDLISCSPNFRLFASMNPSTDLNKKELPPGLRNRFTEFFIDEPEDRDELKCIAEQYLKSNHFATPAVDLYFNLKHICEGTSMTCNLRSFCRSFIYANALRSRSFLRSIYEGFAASFVSQCVNANSRDLITKIIRDNLFKNVENAKSILKQPLPIPTSNDKYEKIGGYWILRGSNDSTLDDTFDRVHVFTGTVQNNLEIICRLVTIRLIDFQKPLLYIQITLNIFIIL
ncbi:hypothetical protein GJ496_003320 [Pomphorhynchus laevis]|nr:hypothetical protein GJ496_003320 [Pomphorhynchus laevis]